MGGSSVKHDRAIERYPAVLQLGNGRTSVTAPPARFACRARPVLRPAAQQQIQRVPVVNTTSAGQAATARPSHGGGGHATT